MLRRELTTRQHTSVSPSAGHRIVHIRNQHLTVQLTGNTAIITVTFTVVLQPDDLKLLLGLRGDGPPLRRP